MNDFLSRMVLVIVAVIVLVILGLIGWCIWRFFKKKRPKGAEKDKQDDDENALVDNEEANAEEVSTTAAFYPFFIQFLKNHSLSFSFHSWSSNYI